MSKISTYEVVPVPKLADKLIGTSVGGEIEDATYNFTLQELLDLFLPNIPANNLQGVLDYGNTATQDINLFGTITTTNLDVTETANLFITYLNEETHIVGGVYDSEDSIGTSGQVLTSTGEGVAWVTLPPIFTPNLQQVLTEGNTSTIGIVLNATLEALNVDTDDATINTNITIDGTITDGDASVGTPGQVLSSTSLGVEWVNLPAYSAVSPLLFNSVTGVFSIQQASNIQGGYLSASDWVTFDGKQNAGNYITALTGEATASGPGAASTVLSNAAVIGKVLTGFNPISGTINASDSILTAFGKTQSQINALVGGVQYQGTWNASTNTPTLQSSVGVQGHYYIVNVAGTTNLNGITDWQVGDWAIFSESTWQKVDNTESVTSVNGFTGAVSLTTDNIPEGTTNLYYLDSRARGALSFAAGSGAYNNVTGVITIPTNNNQILNGAGYITLASLSASAPLSYNNLTGGFAIQKSDATHDGYLSSTDWSTFNNKQNYLGGTGLVKSVSGTISYITDNSGNWNTAYDRSIVSAAVTGTSTKTLTLTEQDGNTIQASWTDLDTGLTSVGVSMPSAFTVTNSPLTANGTIGITGAGTTLQYIDGTGALQTFPGLTGFVPYTGANQNVNLGEYGISAGYFQADLTPSGALQVGRMQWNATDGTMDLRLLGNNVTLQIGEENVTRVVNKSGIDLLEENYQVVRLRKVAEGGAQGQRIAVVLAQGNTENNSTEVIGVVTETILSNQEGFVTSFGEVKEINTTGSLQGETWVDGDILYLSSTVAGGLTNVRSTAPNHSVIVGYVSYAHAVHGKIYMAIDTGYELGELHNVYAPSPTANQSIYWNVANSRYQLNTIGGILGYTPADAALTISTTAPLQGGGNLTANRTFSITQSGASSDGYLSSTDWNTFNNKQPAGNYVPTTRLLSINGTQYDLSADRSWSVGTVTSVAALTLGTTGTDLSSSVATGTTTPVITLNVPTASAANRGALSAADWSTFNTKVGSVTASSPLASSGGSTPNITIQQASGSQDGYLSSTDWTTFNNKQVAGDYITSLTGEATATGPGAATITLNNAAVTGKVLTGINITGGTVVATDSILTGFGKLQNQINGLIGSTIYQGTWNANTNTPALASSVGTRGYYYIVNVAGNTNLNGITDWQVGDWAIFDGTAWQKVDNTDAVSSVNGFTGAVSLTTDNIPEGTTNLYFTNARSRSALSFTAGSGAYNSTTGVITIPTNTNQLTNGASFITLASLSGTAPITYNNTTGAISITQAGTATNGYLSSTDWNTFNNKQVAGNYVTLDTVQTITAGKTFSSSLVLIDNGLKFKDSVVASAAVSGYVSMWFNINGAKNSLGLASSATSPSYYTYDFPNLSGTLALTSDLSSYVPYTGATGGVDLGIYGLTAFSLYLKKNGSGGSGIIWDTATSMVVGTTNQVGIAPVSTDGFGFYFGGATKAFYFLASNITTQRVYTMPNASGTIALTSDIPTNPVGGTGTTNYLPKFTGTSTIGNSLVYDNSTSVFINAISAPALGSPKFFVKMGTANTYEGILVASSSNNNVIAIAHTGTQGIITTNYGTSGSNTPLAFGTNGVGQMTLDTSGSLGLGVTPSAWGGGNVALDMGGDPFSGINASLRLGLTTNAYAIGATYYYRASGLSSQQYRLSVGTNNHEWYVAPSGTAGAAITFTQAMTLFANGGLGLGTTTPTTSTGYNTLSLNGSTGGQLEFQTSGVGKAFIYSNSTDLRFYTNGGSYRFENTSGLEVGYSVSQGLYKLDVNGTGRFSGNLLVKGSSYGIVQVQGSGASVWQMFANPSDELRFGRSGVGDYLTITNSGAATFSSSVTAGGLIKSTNAGAGFRHYYNNGSGNIEVSQRSDSKLQLYAYNGTSYTDILLGVDGSTTGGNVGIGTTSPIFKLHVSGGSIGLDLGQPFYYYYLSSVNHAYTMSDGSGNIIWGTGTGGVSQRMQLTSGGNVLINTTTDAGYKLDVNGTGRFSGTLTTNGMLSIGNFDGQALKLQEGTATGNSYLRFYSSAGGALGYLGSFNNAGTQYTLLDGSTTDLTLNGYANLYLQTGGTNRLSIDSTGAATFSSSISTGERATIYSSRLSSFISSSFGGIYIQSQGYTGSGYNTLDFGSSSYSVPLARIGVEITGSGTNMKFGTSDNYSTGITKTALTLDFNGAATFGYSVTASSFFESSDSRLKKLIKDDYRQLGIESVKARLYIKDGKEEIGYYAQDLQSILPSAISKNDAGFLSLSYTQVHTAKIAFIEDEVDILKRRVSELESKLQKYEA